MKVKILCGIVAVILVTTGAFLLFGCGKSNTPPSTPPADGSQSTLLAKPDNAFVRFNYRYGNFLLIGVILIFTVFGYIASYIGVNIDIFSRWQGLFIDLIEVVQSAIVGGA